MKVKSNAGSCSVRSWPSRLLGAVLVLSLGVLSLASDADAQEQPHIVLLLADDLGYGDVGFHGGRIATPHLDRLAERGVRFNQFYVQPVCSPTRGALLTGRYPMRLGLQCGVVRPWAEHGLPLDERTLPQALREVGYTTALCGKWHLGHAAPGYLPTRRGFDHQYGHYNGALDYFTHIRDGGHDWHRNDRANYDKGYTTDLIAGQAERIIAEHDQSKPLFLYVPFNAPHTPLQAPDKYIQRYAHIKNQQRRIFAAMVTCMDDAVGRITSALKKHKFPRKNTLVFFCSDNGGIRRLGSNRELRAGKGTLYEGGVRVPAVMVWDDVLKDSSTVDEPLHIVDLYPTLLRLAGARLKQHKPLDGKDAWETITEGKPTPHDFILHNATPFHAAIRQGDWKLIHNGHVGANAVKAPPKQQWELFNIRRDPSEKKDLSAAHPKVCERLKKKLTNLSQQAVKPNIAPNRPRAGFKSPKVWGEGEPAKPPRANQQSNNNHRRPKNDEDLRRWLENMAVFHQFTLAEMSAATGHSTKEIAAALKRFGLADRAAPSRKDTDPLVVLPYPGGRHPRIGFLDGAVNPQRETKVSVFAPWSNGGYVVVDVPEAIWWTNTGQRELLYLAHTHVPTHWTKQSVELPSLEWSIENDGSLSVRRMLPNKVEFGARVAARDGGVRMELWITNGAKQTLTGLRVQNCVMLAHAKGFAQQTNDNKVLRDPFVACRDESGRRWVITAWEHCVRPWTNPPCPCMHSDPQFPDCPPGQTKRLHGWLSFYKGEDLEKELERIKTVVFSLREKKTRSRSER